MSLEERLQTMGYGGTGGNETTEPFTSLVGDQK